MIKAILFDADGMIVTGERFSNRLAREYGITLEKTDDFFKKEWSDCILGKTDLKTVLAPYLSEWGWQGTLDELLDFWFDEKYNVVDTRFREIIKKLQSKGFKCYLATNNEKYRTDSLVKNKEMGSWFDGVFSSAYMGVKKPDPTFFQKILDGIDLKKEEVIFWDDDPENIEGAEHFGLATELYTDFDSFKEKTA